MNTRVKTCWLHKTLFGPNGPVYTVKIKKLEFELPRQLHTEAEYHLSSNLEVEVDLTEDNPLTQYVNDKLRRIQAEKERKRVLEKKRKAKQKATRRMRKAQ